MTRQNTQLTQQGSSSNWQKVISSNVVSQVLTLQSTVNNLVISSSYVAKVHQQLKLTCVTSPSAYFGCLEWPCRAKAIYCFFKPSETGAYEQQRRAAHKWPRPWSKSSTYSNASMQRSKLSTQGCQRNLTSLKTGTMRKAYDKCFTPNFMPTLVHSHTHTPHRCPGGGRTTN